MTHPFKIFVGLLALAGPLAAQSSPIPPVLKLPPSLSASGTGVVVDGAAWGYVVWQATAPEWYEKNHIAVYLKPGPATSTEPFVLQGTMAPLTDPSAITAWVNRAARLSGATGGLAENLSICKARAQDLIEMWSPTQPAVLPGALVDCLSVVAGRAAQEPNAAATLRTMGANHPMYRFLTGTGWAGPLNVPIGQDATLELREVAKATGIEGSVVARVTVRATNLANSRISPDLLLAPDAVVQVKPDWPANPPAPELAFIVPPATVLPDLAPALRWSIPDELRRQILLSRGFMVWRSPISRSMTTPENLINSLPLLKALLRNPAPASKLFSAINGTGTGPGVENFFLDRNTWFYADDNERYDFTVKPPPGQTAVITGTPHAANTVYHYYAAPVDLLGRYGPPSAGRTSTAIRTLPPAIPKIKAVENIVSNGNQRLRISFNPVIPQPGEVPVQRYLIFRDRNVNIPPSSLQTLDSSIDPAKNNDLIYVGQVAQPGTPTAQTELTFVDQALAPVFTTHYGLSYYYCIRAVNDVPGFGMNISSPSAPVFGTMRDREGPPAPTGIVAAEAARPAITFLDQAAIITDSPGLAADTTQFRFRFTRQDRGVSKVRLRIRRNVTSGEGGFIPINLPEFHFGGGDSFEYDYAFGGDSADVLIFTVEAISENGRVSHANVTPGFPLSGFQKKKTYTIEIGAATGGVLDMAPELNFLWQPYFRKAADNSPSVYPITVSPQGDGTFSAAFPGGLVIDRNRTLLVQRRVNATSPWLNYRAARLPVGQTQFSFLVTGILLPNAQYRVWEIIDPAGSADVRTLPHDRQPGAETNNQPVNVTLSVPAGATEYRLYRRIDQGSLFLLKQDTGTWDPATVKTTVFADGLLPPAGGTISYFGQTFDEHGNPSPLALLDQKIGLIPDLPVPVVDVLESGGSVGDPRMILRTSCPSPGVERIEVIITPKQELTTVLASQPVAPGMLFNFTPGSSPSAPQSFDAISVSNTVVVESPSQPFIYNPSIRIKAGVEYTVQVRALGIYGTSGIPSAEQKFTWTEPLVGSAVPWPARPGPLVIPWSPQIQAFRNLPEYQEITIASGVRPITDLTPGFRPVAVQIGSIPLNNAEPRDVVGASNWQFPRLSVAGGQLANVLALYNAPGFASPGPADLFHQYLARKVKNDGDISSFDYSKKLFPIVLYRQQTHRTIAGTQFSVTGADLVQVSPMMENIAWAPFSGAAILLDPYIGVLERNPLSLGNPALSLCLFDCSPVTAGASYRYYLVHFTPEYEPDFIIDAGSVTLPSNP